MKGRIVICDYCGTPADFVDSSVVYHGHSFGMIYLCPRCGAYVGVHKGSDKPLGRLANSELRNWKKAAHAAFDPLWKYGPYRGRRNEAYRWLSEKMGTPITMAFNKGYELKKFEAHWEKLRIEYAAAGMAGDAIQKMYDYDRQQFNSERTCIERTQEFTAPAYESSEEEASPLMLRYQEAITTTDTYHETKRSFAWIGEIENERLLSALETLSEDLL